MILFPVIGGKIVCFSVEVEAAQFKTVGNAADERAKVIAAVFVSLNCIIAKSNINGCMIFVVNDNGLDCGAIINKVYIIPVCVRQSVQCDMLVIFCFTKWFRS